MTVRVAVGSEQVTGEATDCTLTVYANEPDDVVAIDGAIDLAGAPWCEDADAAVSKATFRASDEVPFDTEVLLTNADAEPVAQVHSGTLSLSSTTSGSWTGAALNPLTSKCIDLAGGSGDLSWEFDADAGEVVEAELVDVDGDTMCLPTGGN